MEDIFVKDKKGKQEKKKEFPQDGTKTQNFMLFGPNNFFIDCQNK